MKKRILFVGTLLLVFTVGAATGTKITAELQNRSVNYLGSQSKQSIIVYKGEEYMKVKSISSLTGLPYSSKGAIITIGQNKATNKYSINKPAPLGSSQTVAVKNYTDSYTAEVCVKEIIRGSEAWDMIHSTNEFNDAPADGKEYLLAKIYIKAVNVSEGKALAVNSYSFTPYSSTGAKYEIESVVIPEPNLSEDIYAGASTEGYMVFEVNESDPAPKFVYGADYDGSGGVWFSLK